ncbi:hypothetical protein MBOU_52530 [Mycobacterium bourgelatii]|uniref:Uncharacterized protein n=1 Tax=Mycobacterium bourgelatii TaxID=1273442 RepID=A0A7I9YX12_MYCBU|nr:hypothetical protein MBOU_52530 [Mycobacterium bourgelatii]
MVGEVDLAHAACTQGSDDRVSGKHVALMETHAEFFVSQRNHRTVYTCARRILGAERAI